MMDDAIFGYTTELFGQLGLKGAKRLLIIRVVGRLAAYAEVSYPVDNLVNDIALPEKLTRKVAGGFVRKLLKTLEDLHIVLFTQGGYRLNKQVTPFIKEMLSHPAAVAYAMADQRSMQALACIAIANEVQDEAMRYLYPKLPGARSLDDIAVALDCTVGDAAKAIAKLQAIGCLVTCSHPGASKKRFHYALKGHLSIDDVPTHKFREFEEDMPNPDVLLVLYFQALLLARYCLNL